MLTEHTHREALGVTIYDDYIDIWNYLPVSHEQAFFMPALWPYLTSLIDRLNEFALKYSGGESFLSEWAFLSTAARR